jgi:unsaturated rhamnogalacturonyl hydrolase
VANSTANSAIRDLLCTAARRTARWDFRLWGFGESIALRGLLAAFNVLQDREFLGFVEGVIRSWTRRTANLTYEDHAAPGFELLEVYDLTGDTDYFEAAGALAQLCLRFPEGAAGCRLHRPDFSGWSRQIWVDCLHVDPAFLARFGVLTRDIRWIEEAEQMLLGYARLLQETSNGLFWHGYEMNAGRNGQPWARGNGWALLGLVETIPTLDQAGRDTSRFREITQSLARGLQRYQSATGLWHTIVTEPSTYEESTLAVAVAYAFEHAFNSGVLCREEFRACQQQARNAVLPLINHQGELQLVSEATPIGDLRNYATRPFGVYPWGQGVLLQMLAQEAQSL